jgi:hypothetical protein
LFGGLSEQEFYRRYGQKRYPTEEPDEITGYVEFDLENGEIKSYNLADTKPK